MVAKTEVRWYLETGNKEFTGVLWLEVQFIFIPDCKGVHQCKSKPLLRKRHISLYNPPYNFAFVTPGAKSFFKLLAESLLLPQKYPRIFNTNPQCLSSFQQHKFLYCLQIHCAN